MLKQRWTFYSLLLLGSGILYCCSAYQLHHKIARPFIEYQMRRELENQDIVVSFTTTPYRINALRHVIQQLMAQNVPIKQIYLSIPYKFARDNLEYVIPKWLSDHPDITILRTEDYGPATKLLGVLKEANLAANTIIITVDDDIYYPSNLVLQLAYLATQNPGHAVGVSGANVRYDKSGQVITDYGIGLMPSYRSTASILEGFGGIAYRRNFFEQDIFDIVNAPKECINSDDLYISFYLAKKGIPRDTLRNQYISLKNVHWNEDIGMKQDALHKLIPTQADKHAACISFMKHRDPDVIF